MPIQFLHLHMKKQLWKDWWKVGIIITVVVLVILAYVLTRPEGNKWEPQPTDFTPKGFFIIESETGWMSYLNITYSPSTCEEYLLHDCEQIKFYLLIHFDDNSTDFNTTKLATLEMVQYEGGISISRFFHGPREPVSVSIERVECSG